MVALSCGIKISAAYHLVLSKYTHLTDRWTDRQTELRQQYRALHYMQSHGKTSNLTAITEVQSTSFRLVFYAQHIFANSFSFLVTWVLPVTIFHSTCIFCVCGMALYWPTLQFYVCDACMYCVWRYVAPPGECYYNSPIMLRLFFIAKCGIVCFLWAVCMFGHHPHPLGYLRAKFCFFRNLNCWASPWRKTEYSITL